MKNWLKTNLSALVISTFIFLYSQYALAATPKKPEQVKLGVYIMQLYDLNLTDKSFNAIFWVWSLADGKLFHLKNDLEIANAEKLEVDLYHNGIAADGRRWESIKYNATFLKDWNLSLFPFDRQVLEIYLESALLKSGEVQFVPNIENSKLDKEVELDEWEIMKFELIPQEKVYESEFELGQPGESKYSRIVAQIHIERKGLRKFIQYLGVTYLAGILGLCIYLLPVRRLESRINLLSGAIFAAVGNKIMLDNTLPTVATLTLVDKVEIIVFISLCVALFITLLTSWADKNHEEKAAKWNRYGFIFSVIFLLAANFYIFLPLWR